MSETVWQGTLSDNVGTAVLRVIILGNCSVFVQEMEGSTWVLCADDALTIRALSIALLTAKGVKP